MTKVKENAAIQLSAATSTSFDQINTFAHQYDRGGNLTVNGKPSYSVDQAADYLLRDDAAWADRDGNGTINLTYTFLTAKPAGFNNSLGTFSAFNAQQKAQAVLSMQSWADVAKVSFTQAASGGDGHMTFGNYSDGNAGGAAFAYLPSGNSRTDGQSWYLVDNSYKLNTTPDNGNYGRHTLTHEIGHTLGLSHPGDYNAGEGNPSYKDASYAEDTLGYSVMSYWSESNTDQNFVKGGAPAYSSGPQLDDIAAVQQLYGANMSTRAGDTVYGFNSTAGRDFYSATSAASKVVFSVWDGGGKDTLDFSGFTQNQKINLNAASFSDVGGMVGNVSIAKGVVVENAVGGSGNDLLIGNAAANDLKGGAGNDIIYGGAGADSLTGGAGADVFVFGASSDSNRAAQDTIRDFVSGQDKIDVSAISTLSALQFVNAFSGHAGEAILNYNQSSNLGSLAIDFTGQGLGDFLVGTVGQAFATDIVV
ncbi:MULTISPECIES: serralysin family metalloprotease [Pseudomonas syringae group]|uniref:serralysin family metalloprotease n=2 Tax=Pseudomonas TaxID=286 RepID=UPI0006D6507F|nr:serralysin family metalloprotease [Pseudomonas coronafaciens]KPX29087.1 Serralysin [Pseudomonas coronafaciens pv. garcae]RMN89258.1 Serralysin [Pseudomonas coronafaciens pv. coronafaciens]RMS90222.1 Serralysin [Pseudomonas coronafaciens pv. oryzae]RMV89534.1 Serralysin [Pseudomonas coronafaciens pv. garcae]